jgi:hypothetical protein
MRHVQNDPIFTEEAKKRFIDARNWARFSNSYRRNLIKEPLVTLNGDHTMFVEMCKFLKPLSTVSASIVPSSIVSEATENKSSADVSSDAATKMGGEKKNVKKGGGSSKKEWTKSKEMAAFDELVRVLKPHMMQTAELELHSAIAAYRTLCNTSDLKNPEEWYPYARLFKRKIIYHGGPTNSGKTYKALLRLKDADAEKGGGLYCGPLRLLALEVYENLNRQGVYTNLVTGQEKREVPFATHTSSTLEMVNMANEYDVAVIDEIQMIADKQRGYAWTRALQGLRAREIHVCGGLEAFNVVKNLVESMGDDFELEKYDRLGALEIQEESLRGDYSRIEPGDAIVAFSRADIFSIRRQVEKLTPYKCSVIYGQLPPETRSMQARLFNDETNQVLVASDAIGMGLNLNIRRAVFHTTIKRGAEGECYFVDPSNVKQIAGRAGRLSSKWKTGLVTTWQEQDLAYVRAVMQWDIPQITAAGVFPSVEQIELFSEQLEKGDTDSEGEDAMAVSGSDGQAPSPEEEEKAGKESHKKQAIITIASTTRVASGASDGSKEPGALMVQKPYSEMVRLSTILDRFIELSQIDGRYFLCEHDEMMLVSNWLHTVPLTLAERFVFANAPVNTNDSLNMTILYQFAATYAQRRPVACNIRLLRQKPKDVEELAQLCSKHNAIDLYIWLSLRFPKYFVERDLCLEQKAHAVKLIEQSLEDQLSQAAYSHSLDYMNIRKRLMNRTLDGLPPLHFGDVRSTTRANLSKLEPDVREVFPHLEAEGGAPDGPAAQPRQRRASHGRR